jgi:uncharacterized damage-inducible protein DinB
MIDVSVIQQMYRYNGWANARLIEAVSRVTADQFTRDLGSSYPSLRDTLVHIVWAEWIWLQRWKGISPQTVFQPKDFPDVDAVRARWSEVESEQRAFLETVTSERLLTVVSYINLQGQTWRYPLWQQMYHVVNHSTYHRGQLTTMLRQVGAQATATDFLVFYDETGAAVDK